MERETETLPPPGQRLPGGPSLLWALSAEQGHCVSAVVTYEPLHRLRCELACAHIYRCSQEQSRWEKRRMTRGCAQLTTSVRTRLCKYCRLEKKCSALQKREKKTRRQIAPDMSCGYSRGGDRPSAANHVWARVQPHLTIHGTPSPRRPRCSPCVPGRGHAVAVGSRNGATSRVWFAKRFSQQGSGSGTSPRYYCNPNTK